MQAEIETETVSIRKSNEIEIDTQTEGIAGTGTEKERDTGEGWCPTRRTARKKTMKDLVLIVIGVVNVCDYQGVILSQAHQLYQGQYSIGK